MSLTISSDTISAAGDITIPAGSTLYSPPYNRSTLASRGSGIQLLHKRIDSKLTYSVPVSANNPMSDFDMTIHPKTPNSRIIVRYCMSFELYHNVVFRLARNSKFGSVNGSSQQNDYYNVENPSVNRWVGTWISQYDNNNASTPLTKSFMFIDEANGDSTITYSLHLSASGGSATTMFLNRCNASTGSDDYEVGISSVIVQEIA